MISRRAFVRVTATCARLIVIGAVFLLAAGCGQNEKIAELEKQNEELKAEVEKNDATADYDLQAKCSTDAKSWFNDNWSRDKDTTFLDFTNHYNKSLNKCFISVEYHFSLPADAGWENDVTFWDVYENAKYGDFSEEHFIYFKPTPRTYDKVTMCYVADKKCAAAGEYNDLLRPYMNN
jgi:outer membrane murein-binding lipoprotein Lpp